VTPGQCSTVGDTVKVNVFGGTDVAGGLIAASIPAATPKNIVGVITAATFFNPTGGMTIGSPQTWSSFASANGLGALNGTYTLTAVCGNGDTFQGDVIFTGTNVAGATYISPNSTTTALAPITSPVNYGTTIPVSATITPSSAATLTGTVAFKEGTTLLASTTTISVAGVATATIPAGLTVGAHSITAVYTPDAAALAQNPPISGSTSSAQSVTVSGVTGTLGFNGPQPTTAGVGGTATFSIACGPSTVAGTLTVNLVGTATTPIFTGPCTGAAPVSVQWFIAQTQTQEAGTIVASFLPNNSAYSTPANVSTPFTVTAATGVINNETIQVTVPVGALSATVVNNPTVVLGNWTLNASGRYNTATGLINPVKVIDTRAGDFGWTMSARADDFVPCASYSTTGLNYFNADPTAVNVLNQPTTGAANPGLPGTGLTLGGLYQNNATQGLIPGCISPSTLASAARPYQKQAISANNLGIATSFDAFTTSVAQAGTNFTPNTGLVPFAIQPDLQLPGTGAGATKGVRVPRLLVDATGGLAGADGQVIGSATGVVNVQGALTLNVPTVTVSGSYATTLTLTVVTK
jgi:hypothetical protein